MREESRVRERDFQKLSSEREDEDYKGNTRTFWKVLLLRREFQFLTF